MKKILKKSPIGLIVGFANGLFGAGGGTLLIPALERFIKIDIHKAHATALAFMLPLSVLSAFIYVWGRYVDWYMVLSVSAGGVIGGYIGALLMNKISAKWLHRLFGLFMIAAAARMIWQAV